jgi:hypothetical protein
MFEIFIYVNVLQQTKGYMIKERKGDDALRVCDKCGHEQWVNYWNIYRKGVHICRTCSCRNTAETREKKDSWNKGKKLSPKNLGSSYINTNGYREVWIGEHTLPGRVGGYYKEHRILKELEIGRELSDREIIHHVDGDKINNKLENLFVCNGQFEHRKLHGQLERVAMGLVRSGLISFDHKIGEYFIDPNIREVISKSLELLETPEKDNQQRSFSEMSDEERSTTIQKWSTLKRVEAGDLCVAEDDIVCSE